jgi:hypothetical protein
MHALLMRDGINRVYYYSATPAQDPDELREYYALGYWNLSPTSWDAFVNIITGRAVSLHSWAELMEKTASEAAKLAAEPIDKKNEVVMERPSGALEKMRYSDMEQLIRELSSEGKYLSRDLSRYGVTFEVQEYTLNDEEKAWLRSLLALFRDIHYYTNIFSRMGDSEARKRAGRINSQLQFAMKRIYQALRLKKLLPYIEQAIAEGKQVVLYAESVSETTGEEGNIASAIDAINTQEFVQTESGLDYRGEIPEAVEAIARLRERAKEFAVPDPISVLQKKFGKDAVVAVTGKNAGSKRKLLIKEFQDGKSKIALVSRAGSTGISLHDVNGAQRVLILLDTPWRADDFRQVLGRVDRTGQQSAPHIVFASVGQAGERKIISTIARRLRSLGALSKGEAAAVAGSSALGQFEIEPNIAKSVVRHLWESKWRIENKTENFTHNAFTEIDVSGERKPKYTLGQDFDFNSFLLDLLVYMDLDVANEIYNDFIEEYRKWIEDADHLSEKLRGSIVFSRELRPGFHVYLVENEHHVRFGIVGGKMILPRAGEAPYIVEVERIEHSQNRPKYMLVRDKETGKLISGVRVTLNTVSALMSIFDTGGEFTADKAFALLSVDKAVYTFSPRTDKPYRLIRTRVRDTGEVRIRIDNARMDDKEALFRAGAAYDARLSYWYIPYDEPPFRRFIQQFPLLGPERSPEETVGTTGSEEEAQQGSIFFRRGGRIEIPVAPPLGEGVDGVPLDDTQAIIFRLGRFIRIARTKKRKVQGWYNAQTGDVVIRRWGDIPAAVHEIAHSIDDEYGVLAEWAQPRVRSPFDEELMPFAPADVEYSSLKEQRAEAFAHFMEALVLNPQFAAGSAPEFYAYLKQKLPPDFWAEWDEFALRIRRWLYGDAGEKIRSHFSFDRPSPADFKGTFRIHWVDALMKIFVDDRWAAIKAWREALRRTSREVRPHEDFELLISLWAGRYGTFEDILHRGMPRALDGSNRSVSLIELLRGMDTSSWEAFQNDALDLFAFMGAQRTLELWDRERLRVYNEIRDLLGLEESERSGNPLDYSDIEGALARLAGTAEAEEIVKRAQKLLGELEEKRYKLAGWGGGIFKDDELARQYLAFVERDPERYSKMRRLAEMYRDIADAVLDYAVAGGRLSAATVDEIRQQNQYYEAWYRVFGLEAPRITAVSGGNVARVRELVWRIHGSTRQIHNPFVTLMESIARAVSEVQRNYALAQFVRVLELEREMYEGEPVLLADIGRRVEQEGKNTIKVYVNGEAQIWEFHPEVIRAFEAWQNAYASEGWNIFARLWGGVARLAYHGVVLHPHFLIWNVIRDTFERLIRSPFGTGLPTARGKADWRFYGGSQAGFIHQDREDYYKLFGDIASEVIRRPRHWMIAPIWALKEMWKRYRRVSELSEESGRLAIYNRAYKHARRVLGYDDWDAKLFAAFASRQYMDFRVAGSLVRVLNRLIPFTSASVRALSMTLASLFPVGGGGGKSGGRGGTLSGAGDMPWHYRVWGVKGTVSDRHSAFVAWVKLLLFGPVVSLLIRWWNRQDEQAAEEYDEFPEYQRYMFWLIRTPWGWLNIPKPYELGVLGSVFEAVEEGNLDGWARALARASLPVDESDFALGLGGLIGAIANYDFFRNRWIVPPYEDVKALFDDRGRIARKGVTSASPLARTVGLWLGIDPRKVDYILRQQGGHWGGTLSELSRLAAGERSASFLSQMGIFRELTPYGSETVQKVMKRAQQTGRANEKSVQLLRKSIDRWYELRNRGADRERLQSLLHRIIRRARVVQKSVNRRYRARVNH